MLWHHFVIVSDISAFDTDADAKMFVSHGHAGVSDASLVYLYICFRWISCSIVIVAKFNDKSDKFNSEFSHSYDNAIYSMKIGV